MTAFQIPDPELQEYASSLAVALACELHASIHVCDIAFSLPELVNPQIEWEHIAIAQDDESGQERLLKLRRIKSRMVSFIEASESFIEDIQFLTGIDVAEKWQADFSRKSRLDNALQRLVAEYEKRGEA